MMWHTSRSVRYIVDEVEWPSLRLLHRYEGVTGGSLTWGAFTDLKAGGQLDFVGEPPSERNMLSVTAEITAGGETELRKLGTYFVACAEPTTTPSGVTGTADLYSILQVLYEDGPGYPYTASGDAMAIVGGILDAHGVQVGDSVSGSYPIPSHTFEPADSWLTICNWCLSAAGLSSLYPDEHGRVSITRYVEPSQRGIAWEFATGDTSILLPSVRVKRGYIDMANEVKLSYADEDNAWWATATLNDPASHASVEYRGRVKAMIEQVDSAESLDDLKEQARKKLIDNISEIEYLSFSHAWVPVSVNQSVTVDTGEPWQGSITSMSLNLDPSMLTETEARKFVTADKSKITVTGGSYV